MPTPSGLISGAQIENIANVYPGITVTAHNACGANNNTNFTLNVEFNLYCGDGAVQSVHGEQCEAPGDGQSADSQWECIDCRWQGGYCGDDFCNINYEYYDDCPSDCELNVSTDFHFCTVDPADAGTVCYTTPYPSPTLCWIITPASAQAAFAIQIDNNINFNSPEINTGIIMDNTNHCFTVNTPGLEFNTNYYWQLKIRDIYGTWSDWAQCTDFFTTKNPC